MGDNLVPNGLSMVCKLLPSSIWPAALRYGIHRLGRRLSEGPGQRQPQGQGFGGMDVTIADAAERFAW